MEFSPCPFTITIPIPIPCHASIAVLASCFSFFFFFRPFGICAILHALQLPCPAPPNISRPFSALISQLLMHRGKCLRPGHPSVSREAVGCVSAVVHWWCPRVGYVVLGKVYLFRYMYLHLILYRHPSAAECRISHSKRSACEDNPVKIAICAGQVSGYFLNKKNCLLKIAVINLCKSKIKGVLLLNIIYQQYIYIYIL